MGRINECNGWLTTPFPCNLYTEWWFFHIIYQGLFIHPSKYYSWDTLTKLTFSGFEFAYLRFVQEPSSRVSPFARVPSEPEDFVVFFCRRDAPHVILCGEGHWQIEKRHLSPRSLDRFVVLIHPAKIWYILNKDHWRSWIWLEVFPKYKMSRKANNFIIDRCKNILFGHVK